MCRKKTWITKTNVEGMLPNEAADHPATRHLAPYHNVILRDTHTHKTDTIKIFCYCFFLLLLLEFPWSLMCFTYKNCNELYIMQQTTWGENVTAARNSSISGLYLSWHHGMALHLALCGWYLGIMVLHSTGLYILAWWPTLY